MIPVSMLQIKAHDDSGWTVTQKFEKLGKPVTVYAWGFSRSEALRRFEKEKIWAEMPESDFWSDFGNCLMDIGAWLDAVSIKLRNL